VSQSPRKLLLVLLVLLVSGVIQFLRTLPWQETQAPTPR